jgi:thioredoxin-related protein
MLEFDGRLVALAVPKERFAKVSKYIASQKKEGRWDAEDGFLIIDA